ncbi:MAG: AraC family transcriptional regulator [Algicola sp.]|nr:AraC family transcriptional regulator [Algicola sp.]
MSESIALLVFFVHLLVALFLLSIRSGNQVSNRFLAFFLFITALDISNFIFTDFYGTHLNLDMLRANCAALLAPTLYFYVKSVIYNDLTFKAKDLVHSLSFVLICLLFVPRFHLVDDVAKRAFYDNLAPLFEVIVVNVLLHLQIGFYLTLIFKLLSRYQSTVLNNYSDADKLTKQWLNNFMLLFLIVFLIALLRNVIKFTQWQALLNVVTPLMMAVTLGFVCWILWQALHHPGIFQGISTTVESLVPQSDSATPNQKDKGIDDSEAEPILARLKAHMSQQKPYLEPALNIDTLAQQLDLTAQDISTLLNRHLGLHFFDFINSYRVNAAADILAAKKYQDKTILDTLYEVGFNSKSSFNTAFKKQLKMTPSQFRQQHLNK